MPGLHHDANVPVSPPRRRPGGPFATTTAYGVAEPQWGFHEPRPMNWETSPYARVPLPPSPTVPLDAHPLLRPSETPALRWFVDQPAEDAQALPSAKARLPALWQTIPAFPGATDPNATIVIHFHRFHHPLIIRPYGLTVNDLLRAIYRTLREEATREEFRTHNVPYTTELHSSLLSWQHANPQPMVNPTHDDQVSVNVRRLMDFKTLFKGLYPSPREPDVWLLHTTG